MEHRRLAPAELSEKELIELLEGVSANKYAPIKDMPQHEDILKFMSEYELMQGDNRVLVEALYKLYAIGKDAPASLLNFTRVLSLCFERERTPHSLFFFINHDFMQIQKLMLGRKAPNNRPRRSMFAQEKAKKHVEDFFWAHEMLGSGDKRWVRLELIYGAYVNWAKLNKTKVPLSERGLRNALENYFKHKTDWKRGRWYEVMGFKVDTSAKDGAEDDEEADKKEDEVKE